MKKLNYLLSAVMVAAIIVSAGCGAGQQLPPGAESLSAENFSKAELKTGLRIFSCPDKNAPMVAIVARVNIGAVNEKQGEEGYSALFSRLITAQGEGNAASLLNTLGSTLRIKHEAEAVILSTIVLKEDSAEAAKAIYAQLSSDFTDDTIVSAKDALVNDLEKLEESEGFRAQQLLNKTLYPESSRGADVSKRLEALRSLTSESFRIYLERNLRPEESMFAFAGDVTPRLLADFSNEATNWQGGLKEVDAETSNEDTEAEENNENYTPIFVKTVRSSSSQLFLLRRLPPLNPETYYEILAVNRILNGQSTYSRFTALQVALKVNRPIVSSVELNSKESGQMISATVPASDAYKVLSEIMKQMQVLYGGKLLNSRLLGQEISDARNFLKGQLLRKTEELDQLAEFVLWSENAGFESHLPADHLALIDSVSKDRLLAVIDSYFIPALNSMVAVGPPSIVKQFEKSFKVEIVD